MTPVWGFLLLTVLIVGLAGPFPHLVVGILVLVLSGIILSNKYYPGIVNLMNSIFGATQGAKSS